MTQDSRTTSPGVRLFGRAREIETLQKHLDGQLDPVLVLRGDPGVGKSALLQYVIVDGARVVRTIGVESETQLSLAGLHQLTSALSESLAQLTDRERQLFDSAFSGELRDPSVMGLGIALLNLWHEAATADPLVVVIDDAHWIDPVSLEILIFAARRVTEPRIRVVFALREGYETVLDQARFPELLLEPIDPGEAGRLLDEQFPDLPPGSRDLVLEQAAGNPLALVELPTCITPTSSGAQAEDLLYPSGIPLSDRLERVYGRRLTYLDPKTRQRLLYAALDGVASGAGGSARSGRRFNLAGVDSALEQGLVVVDEIGRFAFRHPLVRSAVIQLATPNQRREAHAELARLYEDDLERRASHLSAATVDPSEEVADVLEAAARHAVRRGGAAAAVSWLTRSAELSEDLDSRRRRIAAAAYTAGQAALLDEAASLVELNGDSDAPDAVLTASYLALYREGDVRGTHRRVHSTIRKHAETLDPETYHRLINLLLAIDQFAGDEAHWSETDALLDSQGEGVEPFTLIYRDAWGDVVRRGTDVAPRIRAAFDSSPEDEPWNVMRLAVAAYYVDILSEFRSYLELLVAREAETGAVTNVMTMLQLIVLEGLGSGAWDDAEAAARRGLTLTEEHGYALFHHQFRAFLGVLAARRGELDDARSHQSAVETWGRARGVGFLTGFAEAIAITAAIAEQDWENAYTLAAGVTTPGGFAPYVQQAPRTFYDLIDAAVHTGRGEEARAHVEAALNERLGELSPRLEMLVLAAQALVAENDDDASELFLAALQTPGERLFPFDAARIRLDYGAWLRRHREYSLARETLDEAARIFDELRAVPWAQRAREEGRIGKPLATGPESLTSQERHIAELAASGLSNKQIGAMLFLSPRTVGAHLYRIFPKLGISSRASLRDALTAISEG